MERSKESTNWGPVFKDIHNLRVLSHPRALSLPVAKLGGIYEPLGLGPPCLKCASGVGEINQDCKITECTFFIVKMQICTKPSSNTSGHVLGDAAVLFTVNLTFG